MKKELSIILPVFNEKESLPIMVRLLNSSIKFKKEIIIIYDFENDNTIQVAKELAEELSGDLYNLTGDEEMKSNEDVLKNMMKNPKKMMGVIKMIGDKIKNKMDSGDISKD